MAAFMDAFSRRLKLDFFELSGLDPLLSDSGNDLESLLETLGAMIEMSCAEGFVMAGSATPTLALPQPPHIDPYGTSLLRGPKIPRSTAVQLQSAVHRAVINEYRDVPQEEVGALYRPLFDLLFSKIRTSPRDRILPIFTTNYDPAIEVFVQQNSGEYDLIDGFRYIEAERREGWASEYFDGWRPSSNKRHLVLFKLHGSADWITINSRIRRAEARYVADGEEHWTNCLIYPARRKVALQDPYFTCYDYFARCLDTARVCLTIGYSFRDYDALMRLRAATLFNEKLRLLLVSPNAADVLREDGYLKGRVIPINAPFGLPTSSDSNANYLSFVAEQLGSALLPTAESASA
jgi:hypothetical protein